MGKHVETGEVVPSSRAHPNGGSHGTDTGCHDRPQLHNYYGYDYILFFLY